MSGVTPRQLALDLPDIPTVRRRSQALAILDAILCPEWAYRYFSFDSRWGPGEEMASMRNGSGDEYSIGELVRRLNPEVGLADLREDLAEIGCPTPVDETAER